MHGPVPWLCRKGGKWASMGRSLTMISHQNSATSPILMELSSVSQISSLNILPTMISMGTPASRLSSITVRSKSSFSVWKWKVNCPRESPVVRVPSVVTMTSAAGSSLLPALCWSDWQLSLHSRRLCLFAHLRQQADG